MEKKLAAYLVSIFCICEWSFLAYATQKEVVRVGFFPNITQAQALVAANMSRDEEGRVWLGKRLGEGTKIEWLMFNAGPSAMEAIFAKSLDLSYVGPSPALNAYLRSQGKEVRVLAGAAKGGDALLVRNEAWKSATDLRGKTICTPQLGNTQDIACRAWLIHHGLKVTLTGGDVRVIPMENADIFAQFSCGAIDGAWTVEPWVSRLIEEAQGHILYSPKDSLTTILVSRADFLKEQPELARRFLHAHRELTDWINAHPEEAQKRICDELSLRMKKKFPLSLTQQAWKKLQFEHAIDLEPFKQFIADARLTGLFRMDPATASLAKELPGFIEPPLPHPLTPPPHEPSK